MALSDATRSAVSFKKLIGFANTQDKNAFYSESIPSQVSIGATEVFGEEIPENPASAVSNGVAQKVQLELGATPNGGQPGFSYELLFPESVTLQLKSGSVDMSGKTASERKVRNWTQIVPQKLDTSSSETEGGYGFDLFKNTPANASNRVSPVASVGGEDPVQWQVDPVASIIVAAQELEQLLTSGASSAFLSCYVYTGRFLDGVLQNLPSGATSGGLDIIVDSSYGLTSIEDESAGTLELRVDLGSVLTAGTGINLSGPTGTNDYEVSVDTSYLNSNYIKTAGSNTGSGTYNFNSGSLIADESTGLDGDSPNANGVLTMSAENVNLNNSGTLSLNGNLNVIAPSRTIGGTSTDFGKIQCNSLTELSSERFKNNIVDTGSQVDKISNLRPVTYETKSGEEQYGLVAEEVAEVYPEFVRFDEDGPKSVNYSRMVSVLIQSVKDLKKEVDRLS
jgi:hypothetical protein